MSGGIEAVPGIRMAKAMGLHVVVSDANPQAPGFAAADDRIIASTYDVEGTVRAAVRYHRKVRPLDGVLCVASDVPLTVAAVASELGLQGISLEAARLASEKLAMKERFAGDGVAVPWFQQVASAEALRQVVDEHGYPVVVKPVDSRGARGVLMITPAVDLGWAYGFAYSHSPTGRVMVEQFMPGPQVSTESVVIDGTAYTPGFSDRNYEYLERYAPHMIENGGELPSHLSADIHDAVTDLVAKAAASMGVTRGTVKGDIVVTDGVPFVIELAPRLSGGYFCTHEIPLNTGVDFVRQAIRIALGEVPGPEDLAPRFDRGVAQRYLFPRPGRVVRVDGARAVAQREGIALCEVRVAEGSVVGPADSHPARAGVVIATAASREEAVARAEAAVRDVTIHTEPV